MMKNNRVQRAINNTLSSLYITERDAARLLDAAKGGKKVKKKLSVVMVMAMIALILTATAVAATLLWEKYVVDLKKTEKSIGTYGDWEINNKSDLIKSLMDMGYIVPSEETNMLLDPNTTEEQKNAIADSLMLKLTNQTDIREINADIITYAVFGPESTWTSEQRVWWHQVTNLFRNTQGDVDTLVTARKDDLSQEQAIAIAKEAIIKGYGLPSDGLDKATPVADMYITKARPEYRRWMVQFQFFKEGTKDYLVKVYATVVDEHGQVIADPDVEMLLPEDSAKRAKTIVSGRPTTPLFQTIDSFNYRANLSPFTAWPLELKAEFSQVVAPQVRAIVDSGDLSPLINGDGPDLYIIASSSYTYGLPSDKDIKQEEALNIARQSLIQAYDLSNEVLALYDNISVYFDITNPEEPLWKFLFLVGLHSDNKFPGGSSAPQWGLQYKVEIAARTGEVIRTEEFPRQLPGRDINYMLKLF